MSIAKKVLDSGLKGQQHLQSSHVIVMFDEQGKEVQITTHMVQHACLQLLKRCRNISH